MNNVLFYIKFVGVFEVKILVVGAWYVIDSRSCIVDLIEVTWDSKNVTSVPQDTSYDEHRQGKDGADDCAATIGDFPLFFFDGELLWQNYFLVEHVGGY